jgi:hypothetical protein
MAETDVVSPFPALSGPECVVLHREEALALKAAQVRSSFEVPIRVSVEEGHDLAVWSQKFYTPEDPRVPGLEMVAFRIPAALPARLYTLSSAAREMTYVVAVGPKGRGLRAEFEEAEQVLATLRRDIGFFLDDGVDTDDDLRLAQLAVEHEDTASLDGMSAALHDFVRLGQGLGDQLVAMGTWDPKILDRGFELYKKLSTPQPPPDRADIDLRNRLLTLLTQDIAKVRRAAEYLWSRDHRDVYRLFVSTYLRNRRLEARRAAQSAAEQETAPTTPPTNTPTA